MEAPRWRIIESMCISSYLGPTTTIKMKIATCTGLMSHAWPLWFAEACIIGTTRNMDYARICILPNHVHILFRPFGERDVEADRELLEPGERADTGTPLSAIMHSLKSYTAHEANKLLGREGSFWQHESYDHWVRDEDDLERIVAYINANPVKAGLAERSWQFIWSSAHDRYLKDGSESGWLEGTP